MRAREPASVSNTLAPADPDGVVRRVPLFVRVDDRAVPALGLALAIASASPSADRIAMDGRGVTIPRSGTIAVDSRGRALVGYVAPERLTVVPFLDIWTAIDASQAQTLRGLVEDKIVLVLAEPAHGLSRTPVGPMSDILIQAELLNAVLAGSWLRAAPLGWALAATLAVAAVPAWLALALARREGRGASSSRPWTGCGPSSPTHARWRQRHEAGSPSSNASYAPPTPDTCSSTIPPTSDCGDSVRRSPSSPASPRCCRASGIWRRPRARPCRSSSSASRERARRCSHGRPTA